jgi:hypothetical protein
MELRSEMIAPSDMALRFIQDHDFQTGCLSALVLFFAMIAGQGSARMALMVMPFYRVL